VPSRIESFDDPALVVATSGTSANPRLAVLSRGAVEAAVALGAEALGPTADRWLGVLSPFHIGGLLVLMRSAVSGADVKVLQGFDAPGVAVAANERWVSVVPTMLQRMLRQGAELSSAAGWLVGGGSLPAEVAEEARSQGARVVTTYGMTETCGGVVYDGRAFQGTNVRVTEDGEIQLQGPTLMSGYLSDRRATAQVFTEDGWLRTRDAGALVDGELEVFGRLDDAIRTGAETVWPERVEAALREIAGVDEAAVVGEPDPGWGQVVVAYVEAEQVTASEVLAALAGRLARHEVPKEVRVVASLPRTSSGKVKRGELKRL
jgi:O-succinylbenzoic acid--CoA ligase